MPDGVAVVEPVAVGELSEDRDSARIAALMRLFPEVSSDGRIDFEELRHRLGDSIEERQERYGLVWPGKRDAINAVRIPSHATLRPSEADSVDFAAAANAIVEGDNLEVLKVLQRSYHGKVKLIYIDPPYNTGKEFIYPDNFREGLRDYLIFSGQLTDDGSQLDTEVDKAGRFHSRWLSMMYPRLVLGRNLLRDDGVMIVAIGAEELGNLRHLMDEVFGEENRIADLVWEKSRKNDAKYFSVGHDYMLVYAKSKDTLDSGKTKWREVKPGAPEIQEEYEQLRQQHGDDHAAIQVALRAWYKDLPKGDASKKLSRYKHVDSRGVWRDRDISWPGGGGPDYDVIHPDTKLRCVVPEAGWRFADPETMQQQIDAGLVVFRDDHTEPPIRKVYLFTPADVEAEIEGVDEVDDTDDLTGMSVMPSVVYRQSQVESKYLRGLLGSKVFDNPKDHETLSRLVRYIAVGDDDLVLDYFAGSGAIGDAVLHANQLDGKNRRFVLVQIPEPTKESSAAFRAGYANIAALCRDRVRKCIEAGRGGGFRAYTLSDTNLGAWTSPAGEDELQAAVSQESMIREDATTLDLGVEILLRLGLPLDVRFSTSDLDEVSTIVLGDSQEVLFVDAGEYTDKVTDLIMGREPRPKVVVVRDSAFAGQDQVKTNALYTLRDSGVELRTV